MGTARETNKSTGYCLRLAFAALGVVYGDIGTSPLYALRACFTGIHGVEPNQTNVLGVLSLVFWSLLLIVSGKYFAFVMRAANQGEGGILALMSLGFGEHTVGTPSQRKPTLVLVGVFGAALLYGDGMITPAISVLSAVEGLNVATPMFEPYIVPLTVAIVIGLFSLQKIGTGRVGRIFGPVTLLWFLSMTGLGLRGILEAPQVLRAFSPAYAVRFFAENGWAGFAC